MMNRNDDKSIVKNLFFFPFSFSTCGLKYFS